MKIIDSVLALACLLALGCSAAPPRTFDAWAVGAAKLASRLPPGERDEALHALQEAAISVDAKQRQADAVFFELQQDASAPQVAQAADAGWRIDALDADAGMFALVPPEPVPAQRAWDVAYALRGQPSVISAEPSLIARSAEGAPEEDPELPYELLAKTRPPPGQPALDGDPSWPLVKMRVQCAKGVACSGTASDPDACKCADAFSPARGAAVTICHPDTGYTRHPESYFADRLLVGLGRNFSGADPRDAHDPLWGEGSWQAGVGLANPGHGTGSSSVIYSDANGLVTGTAPAARIVPIRVGHSVALNAGLLGRILSVDSPLKLARGVQYARTPEPACDVISIAMGLWGDFRPLRAEVASAVDQGQIVVAGAGNYVSQVVYPARYAGEMPVVAVAATDAWDRAWTHSSEGPEVTASAPGDGVWMARVANEIYDVGQGSGTTYSTGEVAGLAARWLEVHGGRKGLLAREYAGLPARAVPCAFKLALTRTARLPSGWIRTGPGAAKAPNPLGFKYQMGAGVVDAYKLLADPLPSPADPDLRACLSRRFVRALRAQSPVGGVLDRLAVLVEPGEAAIAADPRERLEGGLQALVGAATPEQLAARLGKTGDELVALLDAYPVQARKLAQVAVSGGDIAPIRDFLRQRASAELAKVLQP